RDGPSLLQSLDRHDLLPCKLCQGGRPRGPWLSRAALESRGLPVEGRFGRRISGGLGRSITQAFTLPERLDDLLSGKICPRFFLVAIGARAEQQLQAQGQTQQRKKHGDGGEHEEFSPVVLDRNQIPPRGVDHVDPCPTLGIESPLIDSLIDGRSHL